MNPVETNQPKKTPGNPCPGCGCPYPGDHTLDCGLSRDEAVLHAFSSVRDTLKNLTDAVSELHKILNRLLKHETGQPI